MYYCSQGNTNPESVIKVRHTVHFDRDDKLTNPKYQCEENHIFSFTLYYQ